MDAVTTDIPRPQEVTHEYSQANPEGFKSALIDSLGRHAKYGRSLWALATQTGLASVQDVAIDPTVFASTSEPVGPRITLGTAPDTAKVGRLFEPDTFSYPREVAYRLVHEVLHKFNPHKEGPFNNLFKYLYGERMRMQPTGRGVTPLGNLFLQGSVLKQALEDSTDLATMYAVDPEYFKRFVAMLADENHPARANFKNLTVLSAEQAERISTDMEQAFQTLFPGAQPA